jgi:hypothetical protein
MSSSARFFVASIPRDLAGFQIAEVTSATPEPSSMLLLGSGVLVFTQMLRRKLL